MQRKMYHFDRVILLYSLWLLCSCSPNTSPLLDSQTGSVQFALTFANQPFSEFTSTSSLPPIEAIRIVVTGENIPEDSPVTLELSTSNYEAFFELFLPEGRNQIIRATALDPAGNPIKTVAGYVSTTPGSTATASLNIVTTPVAEVLDRLEEPDPMVQYLMPATAIQHAVYEIIGFDTLTGNFEAVPSRINLDLLETAVRDTIVEAESIEAITAADILLNLPEDILAPWDSGAAGFNIDFGIPAISVSATPAAGYIPLEVSFQVIATGFGESLRHYKWDFDGDGVWDSLEQNPTFIYTTEGIFQALVDVRDMAGASASAQLTIEAFERIIATGRVSGFQKISDTEGTFDAILRNSDSFGSSVAGLGDFDGDGNGDIVVGTYADDDGGTDRGAVYILLLEADGTVKDYTKISALQGNFFGALDNSDYFGHSVTSLGDLDNDGITDIAVGAYADDDGGTDRGAVYILLLEADGTVKEHRKISNLHGNFYATLDNSDWFGISVAGLDDFDGDGVPDLAVGASGDDDGGGDRGALYLLMLNRDGTVKEYQKISDTDGLFFATLDNSDYFGRSVTPIGDLDGDNVMELAVGAQGDDDGVGDAGAVYILFLDDLGNVRRFQKISDTTGDFFATMLASDFFGISVSAVGDLNADGTPDLAVGAHGDDDGGSNRGAAYILFLEGDGRVKSYRKISNTHGKFYGVLDNEDVFGYSVAGIGDINGDRVMDLAVGAMYDDDGSTNRGSVYILFLE